MTEQQEETPEAGAANMGETLAYHAAGSMLALWHDTENAGAFLSWAASPGTHPIILGAIIDELARLPQLKFIAGYSNYQSKIHYTRLEPNAAKFTQLYKALIAHPRLTVAAARQLAEMAEKVAGTPTLSNKTYNGWSDGYDYEYDAEDYERAIRGNAKEWRETWEAIAGEARGRTLALEEAGQKPTHKARMLP